ncbi:MAG TPA: tetratricopeptide repeat protein [Longimicrobiales bacterium]|nr:tetratricopeptide repeat protein [Longimicrobiales bacterium]
MSQRIPRGVLLATVALAALASACATAGPPVVATPADIPALERAAAANPGDADALTLLGVAYQAAGRHEDAAATLGRAIETGAARVVASLYLGVSLEALERWQDARDAYTAYLAAGTGAADDGAVDGDAELRRDVERRIALVDRELLEVDARRLLEQEAELSGQPAEPRSVAVFPFRVVTDDPRFEPLQLALADMVTTDLSIPGVLVLLERARIQAVVREMALSLAGYAEPATGARVGRLMRAEHVVQGSVTVLPEERVRLEMAVLDAGRRERTGGAEDEGALTAIFDAEKRLVFAVFDALGVPLTAAEREAIEENRARNLLAFLAYGEGLMAMERGDYAAAAAAFGQAAQLDPGFQAAEVHQQEAAELQQAAQTSTGDIALAAATELPLTLPPGSDPRENALNDVVDRTNPNPGSQYTGDDSGVAIAHDGLDDDDTRNDQNEDFIAQPATAPVDVTIPNPTRP